MGAVPGTRENCARLLSAGEGVLVFPGGAPEVYKRRGQEYQLLWGQRTGFARMAIEAGWPIVPFAGVGAEDRFRVMLDTDTRGAWPIGAPVQRVAHRDDVGTLLVRGSARAGLPGTGRLYFSFGQPIPTTRWAGALATRRPSPSAGTSSERQLSAGSPTCRRSASRTRTGACCRAPPGRRAALLPARLTDPTWRSEHEAALDR